MSSHTCFFFRSSSAYAKIQDYLGRIPPKIQEFAHFSLVSLSPPTRSRPGAERIRQGEGRLSHPPKTALERSYLTENSNSESRILRPRRKKTPDRIPPKKKNHTYISDTTSHNGRNGMCCRCSTAHHDLSELWIFVTVVNWCACCFSRWRWRMHNLASAISLEVSICCRVN